MNSVCVFCASSFGASSLYREAAEDLGRRIAGAGLRLVYGGGSVGLMGVVARAAKRAGGDVVGVIPAFLRYAEIPETEITELHIVDSMHARKQKMFDLADGFISLPGGIGTLDETIELMTWAQLGRHGKPLLLVDTLGYWSAFQDLMRVILEQEFARPSLSDLYRVVADPEQAVSALLATRSSAA
ncbi:MAG: TIGR00730 family Rossman fold protein [Alphaproteobacteria bacterium]|nr:TIGR00730 family Rossman fold protein [Alphaproteobacteria bacterium]